MTTTSQSTQFCENFASVGATMPFESIQKPGCYICNWSGHLLRVPEDGVKSGRSPVLNFVGSEPLVVTKISDNPYLTLTKAKIIAANIDLNVNF